MAADVVIIGAGAAGLAALRELDRAGIDFVCLEARARTGGRIFTLRDPLCPIPIELGAEFIHGRPPEIWDIIRSAGLTVFDCAERGIHMEHGRPATHEDAWQLVDEVMSDMRKAARARSDRSFADFLATSKHPEEAKRLASAYVEGFNAARKEVIGIASLAEDARASDEIDGDRSFRVLSGYDAVLQHLLRGNTQVHKKLHLNSVVEQVDWQPGKATVHVRSDLTDSVDQVEARAVIVTVPLGVLQAKPCERGAIRFQPEPVRTLEAAQKLQFGQVFRVVLRFREALWQKYESISGAGFLFSTDPIFPTWWTPLPVHAPVMTGWCSGPRADRLLSEPPRAVVAYAVAALARIVGASAGELSCILDAAYFHNWFDDPFARGAYSYVPAGALGTRNILAEPLEDTLYFAGEATNTTGHSATVHGAIASGIRAARRVLQSCRR